MTKTLEGKMTEETLDEKTEGIVIQRAALLKVSGESPPGIELISVGQLNAEQGHAEPSDDVIYDTDIAQAAQKLGYQNGDVVRYRIVVEPKKADERKKD